MKPQEKDSLEQFIADNRAAFDTERPSMELWHNIESRLPATPKRQGFIRQLYPYWKHAAVACMILTIGFLGGMLLSEKQQHLVTDTHTTQGQTGMTVQELEAFYQGEVNKRLALVASYQPEEELQQELNIMAQPEFRSFAEANAIPSVSERAMLEAIAQEYQAKLEALERVIQRLADAEQQNLRINQPPVRTHEQL